MASLGSLAVGGLMLCFDFARREEVDRGPMDRRARDAANWGAELGGFLFSEAI
jgi:hypothetical protein